MTEMVQEGVSGSLGRISCRAFSLDCWRSGQVFTSEVIVEMVQLGVSGSYWAHFHEYIKKFV